ncbi:putative bifunctional diguanylate cyclase/phosphodiesterase [Mangrovihabitans endophyticus]|uniref:Diguanylate cyclase (GGDEF) domain-containing protein n=1 Tax=Mangrovihabitans endophyticus TaxID=1751298 RepID=A0A8J3FN09_9ACTN|nr:EAL domain-containing protein [Mangrovihabitans endophyticus]GGK88621.1 hypothetical protein GCM10012284_23360 [Mangrovihabitans endophyticus]
MRRPVSSPEGTGIAPDRSLTGARMEPISNSMWRGIRHRLSSMRIGVKIVGISMTGSMIFAAVGAVGQVRLHNLADWENEQYRTSVRALELTSTVRSAVGGQQEAVLTYILSGTGVYRDTYAEAITETDRTIDNGLAALTKVELPEEAQRALSAVTDDVQIWRRTRDVALTAVREGEDRQGVLYTLARLDTVSRTVKGSADALHEMLVEQVADGAQQGSTESENIAQLMTILGLIGAAASLVLSVLLSRSISRPIAEVVDVLTRVASGDLSKKVRPRSRDEIGKMGAALNDTLGVLHRAFDEVHHRATHDSLTGLANRALLRESLEAARHQDADGAVSVVVLLDLDNFKQVNDVGGHAAGDHILMTMAQRLARRVRHTDTAARLGGDEFAVVFTGLASADDVPAMIGQLVASLEEPTRFRGRTLLPKVSVGAAVLSAERDIDAVMRDADEALYEAKAVRKGIRPNIRRGREAMLAAALPKGLAAGQFEVYYQPLIDLGERRCAAVEALVRWHHPELGKVSPAEFIPVAEQTGLINDLGIWVLEQACVQTSAWLRELSPDAAFYVSVNLSPQQMANPTLVQDILEVLDQTGLPPRHLTLEVTESALIDGDVAVPILAALRAQGIRIAIDDFGTGYSSLHYLTSLPVDVVKIDRSLTQELDGSAERAVIIESVVHLGKKLHFGTVAEGVETPEQADQLQALGCRLGQGYLWAKPLPASVITPLLIGEPAIPA